VAFRPWECRRVLARHAGLWVAVALIFAVAVPAASADDFPAGTLALGHPPTHSEDLASGGIVDSAVPPAAQLAANELIVTVSPTAEARVVRQIEAHRGVSLVGRLMDIPAILIRAAPSERRRVESWVTAQRGVTSVQPNAVERPDSVPCQPGDGCVLPNDPGFAYQWYLYNQPGGPTTPGGAPAYGADVDAPLAWSRSRGGSAVRIAIVDTGIDTTHPDLAGKVVMAENFTASNTTSDLSGHGTHVAGIAAASFDNGRGISGVAPNAQLMDVKVLAVGADGQSTGDCADVADGIVWAADHGANVINMSLGSPSPCAAMALAVDYAFAHGALPIAAAGNAGTSASSYPAAYAHVLSVAATTDADELAGFSNRGASWVDVAAPGVGIVSTLPTYDNASGETGYGYLSGTSMAAPIVSGIAALIWDQMPTASANRDVETRIFASAQAIAGTGTYWRYGRVDACRAVTANAPPCAGLSGPPAPVPAPPAPAPPEIAQPVPIQPAPPSPNALPGLYTGSLARRVGPLKLVVGSRGDSLISLRAAVPVRCQKGKPRRVQIVSLSTTSYGVVRRDGTFQLRARKRVTLLRTPRVQLTGRFDRSTRRAQGAVRVTGLVPGGGRCDSGTVTWRVRLA
jgi:thermitase